jgi:hypothetical protein
MWEQRGQNALPLLLLLLLVLAGGSGIDRPGDTRRAHTKGGRHFDGGTEPSRRLLPHFHLLRVAESTCRMVEVVWVGGRVDLLESF